MKKDIKIAKLARYVDKESYADIIALYQELKRDNSFSINDIVIFKSFIQTMCKAQRKCCDGRKIYVSPHEFFTNQRTKFNELRQPLDTNQLIRKLLEHITKWCKTSFGYSKKYDYGKLM